MGNKIILYIVISVVSVPLGALLSYVFNLSAMLGRSHAHDLGLDNFFLVIPLVFVITQGIMIYYFRETPALMYVAIALGLAGLGFLVKQLL
jgi:hypothetical protein